MEFLEENIRKSLSWHRYLRNVKLNNEEILEYFDDIKEDGDINILLREYTLDKELFIALYPKLSYEQALSVIEKNKWKSEDHPDLEIFVLLHGMNGIDTGVHIDDRYGLSNRRLHRQTEFKIIKYNTGFRMSIFCDYENGKMGKYGFGYKLEVRNRDTKWEWLRLTEVSGGSYSTQFKNFLDWDDKKFTKVLQAQLDKDFPTKTKIELAIDKCLYPEKYKDADEDE